MAITLKNLKKCMKCEMIGGVDSFGETFCKNCYRIETLENRCEVQEARLGELETKIELLMNSRTAEQKENAGKYIKQQSRIEQMEEKLDKIKTEEVGSGTSEAKEVAWTEIIKKRVKEELKAVTKQVTVVEKRIELREEEDKLKERKKNNVIIHRLAESPATDDKEKNLEDRKSVLYLVNEVLGVPCEDKEDVRRVFRLGRTTAENKTRPLLIEFKDPMLKNKVLENLAKLRSAEEKLRCISVAHDMTKSEREKCKELVQECKEKQKQEESGEWKYQVRGPPGDMRIVKWRKY